MTTAVPAPPEGGRYDTLDLMRGLVIAFLELFHTNLRFSQEGFDVAEGMPRWLADLLFANGNHGMATNLTISGFIIAYTSIQRFRSFAEIDLGTFYRFRFARISSVDRKSRSTRYCAGSVSGMRQVSAACGARAEG